MVKIISLGMKIIIVQVVKTILGVLKIAGMGIVMPAMFVIIIRCNFAAVQKHKAYIILLMC